MPNSPWTETGSSISLVPVIAAIPGPGDANNLTNTDKIALMAQYAAELAMKTTLDSLASTWAVSSTFYDNAVAAISAALIAAGAPANWATIWPDGTTSGPWTGIKTSLGNLWAQIATQRTALQSAISAYQAAAAQAAAISAAATATITKLNTMALTAPTSAAWASTAKPGLPNGSYPAGSCWLSTDGFEFQVGVDGGSWKAVVVAATGLFGQILTAQLTVANFDNLIPNPNSEQTAPAGGWPSGAWEAVNLANLPGYAYSGNNVRYAPATSSPLFTPNIPVNPGDRYLFQAQIATAAGSGSPVTYGALALRFLDVNLAPVGPDFSTNALNGAAAWALCTGTALAPAGACFMFIFGVANPVSPGGWVMWDAMYARRMADASLIVDGSITAAKANVSLLDAAVAHITYLDASVVTVANLNASNITTGVLSATKVLFGDGSALTTSSRVLTATCTPSADVTLIHNQGITAIPGLGWTMTAASGADMFNIWADIVTPVLAGSGTNSLYAYVVLDGNTASPLVTRTLFAISGGFLPFMVSVSGLTAGSHTLAIYVANVSSGASVTFFQSGTYATCQRIF